MEYWIWGDLCLQILGKQPLCQKLGNDIWILQGDPPIHSNDHTFFTHGTGKSSSRPSWEGWISAMVWLDKKIIAGWQAAKKHRSLQLPLKENGSHISTDVLTLRRNWKTSTYSTTSTTKKPLYTTSKTNLEPENDGFHKKPVFRCFSRNPLSGSMIVPCQFSGA